MPSYSPSTISRIADINAGVRVDKGAMNIAAISTKGVFTVSGGNVLVRGLVGEVTTVVQTQANNGKFISTPTTGSAVDMCAVVDITGHQAGGLLSITGNVADAGVKANAGAVRFADRGLVVAPGTIGFNTDANSTGAYKFSIWYVPLEDGASVAAA